MLVDGEVWGNGDLLESSKLQQGQHSLTRRFLENAWQEPEGKGVLSAVRVCH